MRLLAQRAAPLSTYSDKSDESDDAINNSSLKQLRFNHHKLDNRGLIRDCLALEYIIGFFESLKRKK